MKKYDSILSSMAIQQLTPDIAREKTVIIRTDFNVPLTHKAGKTTVADDRRIGNALQTIQTVIEAKGKAIIISHLGRPKNKPDDKLSLRPVAEKLERLLDKPVKFASDCVGEVTENSVAQLQPGEVLVLENLRFHEGEKKNHVGFAKQLAAHADIYVNEAFSTAHRSHASIVGIPKYLPSYAGLDFIKEVESLAQLMEKPKRPFVMVIGGAKISDKVAAVEHLTKIADVVLVGGGVANNFLKADGIDIEKSYVQDVPAGEKKLSSYIEVADDLIQQTRHERMLKDGYIPLPKIIYPIDVIAAHSPESTKTKTIEFFTQDYTEYKGNGDMFLDIGPQTTRLFRELILQAGTVFWNGPMGVFEQDAFATGTREVAQAVAKTTAVTILGGGDTLSAIKNFGLEGRFDHVSAAGGAALEFLSGKVLPGVKVLKAKK
ncbi:MAG: phosphoglycerate kinase [Patescibacteria group bacterium]